MFNVELVTDDVEKAVAKVHLDQSGMLYSLHNKF